MPTPSALRTATVHRLTGDPENLGRIAVRPADDPNALEPLWARLAHLYASNGNGAWVIPEVGDEVIIGDLNGDPAQLVILGSLYSVDQVAPHAATMENYTKAFVSKSKCTIEIDDDKKIITIITPAHNKVVLNDDTKSIELRDENSNIVSLTPAGITIESAKDITLKATGSILLNAVSNIELDAKMDVKTTGRNITHAASMMLASKGAASAEFSASGQVTVKGAIVMIN